MFRPIEPSSGQNTKHKSVMYFYLMMAQWAETCRRIFKL